MILSSLAIVSSIIDYFLLESYCGYSNIFQNSQGPNFSNLQRFYLFCYSDTPPCTHSSSDKYLLGLICVVCADGWGYTTE